MRVATTIVLNKKERARLTRLAKSKTVSVRLAHRAQLVLLEADGKDNEMIAEELKIGRVQAGRWRERYDGAAGVASSVTAPRLQRLPDILQKVIRANQRLSSKQNEALHSMCQVVTGHEEILEDSLLAEC